MMWLSTVDNCHMYMTNSWGGGEGGGRGIEAFKPSTTLALDSSPCPFLFGPHPLHPFDLQNLHCNAMLNT